MKTRELLDYTIEKGSGFVKGDKGLSLRNPNNLTELHRKILYRRRAEIYRHLNVPLPDGETCPLESCPHCGKSLLDKDQSNDGF